MPLYEYQCEACAHRFERIQKFSDPPIDTCPTCGGSVRKLISSPAIQFKGSGFYINDYAKKPSGDSGKSSGDGGKPASSSGTSSTTDSSTTTSSTNSSASSSSGGSSTSGSSGSSSSGS